MGQWHSYDSIIFIFIFILILILNPGHEEKNRSRSETIYQSISSISSSSGAPEGSMILLQSHSRFLLQSLLNRVQKYAPPHPLPLFSISLPLYYFFLLLPYFSFSFHTVHKCRGTTKRLRFEQTTHTTRRNCLVYLGKEKKNTL